MTTPSAPDFSRASSLPRIPVPSFDLPTTTAGADTNSSTAGPSTTTPSAAAANISHRNASNSHLPMPAPAVEEGSAGGESGPGGREKPVNKPVNVPAGNKRSIIVNACQRGNPVLNGIKGIGWEYGDIVPDYQVGQNTCVLFLSLKYHRLHPEYLHNRIERLKGMYLLRVLLLICDISEHQEPIREITKICLINDMTVMVAWSASEAANYIIAYKSLEHKPPDMLRGFINKDYPGQLQNALTSVKGVNKTDVITLSSNFGSFKNLTNATSEQLSLCPGLGDVKVRRLLEAFNLPFRPGAGSSSSKSKSTSSQTATKKSSSSSSKGDKQAGGTQEPGQLSLLEFEQQTTQARRGRRGGTVERAIDLSGEDGDDADEGEGEVQVVAEGSGRGSGMGRGRHGEGHGEGSPDWEMSSPPALPSAAASASNGKKAAVPIAVEGSPEWEMSDEEVINAASTSAEMGGKQGGKKKWKDPLGSDDEDEVEGDEGEGEERARKKRRVDM